MIEKHMDSSNHENQSESSDVRPISSIRHESREVKSDVCIDVLELAHFTTEEAKAKKLEN